jgi:hypothetical protein
MGHLRCSADSFAGFKGFGKSRGKGYGMRKQAHEGKEGVNRRKRNKCGGWEVKRGA